MFKSWSHIDSKIGRFMQDLDPDKVYTKNEMNDYLVEKEMKSNYSNLKTRNTKKSNGYGKILEETSKGVRLRLCLVEAFKRYFD
jgi:hypothetical protein